MESDRLKTAMFENAVEIVCLHSRVRETSKRRDESAQRRQAWQLACTELHERYNDLAFPGGYDDALERIESGKAQAMEAAICFLELRPYFFRSGYMFKDILRKCKRAPLSPQQESRLKIVMGKLDEWRKRKVLDKELERSCRIAPGDS